MFNCRACAGFSAHWMYTQAYFISRLNELTAYEMGSALMDMPAMAFILISLIAGSCAQFAPDGAQVHHVQDIHFPDGNEHSASVGDTVTFHIELGNINMNPVVPWLCKDNKCIGLYYTPVAVGSTTTILIRATIHIKSDEFFGTWGLHFAGNARFAAESPLLALIYIHDVKRVETHHEDSILWCHDSETFNYVKLDRPPECPTPKDKAALTELGSLTVYTDNYKVQTQPAWSCRLVINSVKLRCVHLQQTREPRREAVLPVSVDVCRQWYMDKSCNHGIMTRVGNPGASTWMTKNEIKVKYNHWWSVCGIKGKPRYFTSYNCVIDEATVTYQAPFLDLFSPAAGRLPLKSLSTHGMKQGFKTIAWSSDTSKAFKHVCRKVVSFTARVSKITYPSQKAASQHKALYGAHVVTNDTVYQFVAIDGNAVSYLAREKDRTSLKAIDAGHCGDEYVDTFTSNSLILQFVSDSFLATKGTVKYTGVNHHPVLVHFDDDPLYKKADEHTNLWRTSEVSDRLQCGSVELLSDTHNCTGGKAVPIRSKRGIVNPEVPDIVQQRLDYLEYKQVNTSREWAKELGYQACLQQRRIHYLQTMQLNIDPSATFSAYAQDNVHVVPRGDIHALQNCVQLRCSMISVVPSLDTMHPPLRSIYKQKGVFVSKQLAFYRPIIQFNHTGHQVTAQLQSKYYANPYLTFVGRCEQRKDKESKENAVVGLAVFEICGEYYIFEENTLVSRVKVSDAGTEQHLIREFSAKHARYTNDAGGAKDNASIPGSTTSMQIKSFATFAPAHLNVPNADFYGLLKSSYYTQEAMLSQLYTLQDALAATRRLQEAAMYTEAQVGRERIHSTVNMMGDVLDGLRDFSIASGEAVGGLIGTTFGTATGMAVESITNSVTTGLATFMDSIFSRVVQIIGIVGGYWAIFVTLVYMAIAGRKKRFNIFAKKSKVSDQVGKRGKDGYIGLGDTDDRRYFNEASNVPLNTTKSGAGWASWVAK